MSRSRTNAAVPVVCAAFVAGVALAGCSDIYFDRRDTISLGADDAVATNRLTHMVDPWPRHSENRNIAFNGERIQSAIERYRHHEVIQPRPESTSNLSQQHLSTVTEKVPSSPPTPPGASAAPVKGNGP